MPIVTLDQARAHLRVEPTYPAAQVEPYLDAAVDAAAQYLNRAIFADAAELKAALDELPSAMTAARVTYETAIAQARAVENTDDRQTAFQIAAATLASARAATSSTLNGVVTNPSIRAAVLLTLGHLERNREDVVVGTNAIELPLGARALLRPYRLRMMP